MMARPSRAAHHRREAGGRVAPREHGALPGPPSTLLILPVALAVDRPWTLAPPEARVWAALLSLAIISTALGYVVYFRILTTAGATNLLLVTLLMPVIALVLGTLVLGERLAPRHFAGMAHIAAGLAVIDGRLLAAASYRPRPNPPQRRESP